MEFQMENEFGNNIYTLTDENGQEIALEHLDTYELGDETYMAFLPANADDLDAYELLILKIDPISDRSEIVTDGQIAARLNTRQDRFFRIRKFHLCNPSFFF